jgi:N-acetylglucosaminyldiphosphoundecaprenol N-acetyl-beta-D-mannosaminyltransferase
MTALIKLPMPATSPTLKTRTPRVDLYRPVHCILGLPVDAVTLNDAQEKIYAATSLRRPCFLSTPNLNFAMACLDDREFRNSVMNSDLSIADGMPLVWVARLLGVPIHERVTGSGLFERLQQQSDRSVSVYLFGGADGAAATAAEKINAQPSGLKCVGSHSPGFGSIREISQEAVIREINDSHADFLLVALGAKKGQAWIEHNRQRLQVPVLSHLGAVINFAAGSVRRAPQWMQRVGLEWAWRIKEEPALWRRYLRDGMVLLRIFLTRVVPGAIHQRLHYPSQTELANNWVSIAGDAKICCIKPHGAWCEKNLLRLRRCLEKTVRKKAHVDIDLSDVTFIDSAFVGLLMLMYGHQSQLGLRFRLHGATPAIRRMFRNFCAGFLLDPEMAAIPAVTHEEQKRHDGWQSV